MIRSRKILAHAKGKPCTLRLPGICNGNPETTVFCHLNTGAAGKGMGLKAHDVLGFFGCSACHTAYDQQVGRGELAAEVLSAVCETWVALIAAGLVVVQQDPPVARKPINPRKPKSQRIPIHRAPSNARQLYGDIEQ